METVVEFIIKRLQPFAQVVFRLFEGKHILFLVQLLIDKCFICRRYFQHLLVNLFLEVLVGEFLQNVFCMVKVVVELCFCSIADEGVATADVEVNVGKRVETEIVSTTVNVNHSDHFKEQTQLRNLSSFNHYIDTVKVA